MLYYYIIILYYAPIIPFYFRIVCGVYDIIPECGFFTISIWDPGGSLSNSLPFYCACARSLLGKNWTLAARMLKTRNGAVEWLEYFSFVRYFPPLMTHTICFFWLHYIHPRSVNVFELNFFS